MPTSSSKQESHEGFVTNMQNSSFRAQVNAKTTWFWRRLSVGSWLKAASPHNAKRDWGTHCQRLSQRPKAKKFKVLVLKVTDGLTLWGDDRKGSLYSCPLSFPTASPTGSATWGSHAKWTSAWSVKGFVICHAGLRVQLYRSISQMPVPGALQLHEAQL